MPVASLIIHNARAVTLNPAQPAANAVAVGGGKILAAGDYAELRQLAGPNTRFLDCGGLALLPGFHDAHCHLLALAAALQAADCRPAAAPSIAALQEVLRQRAAITPLGQWVTGFGYDHLTLPGNSHPTRHDLDAAAPLHPATLEHRSGHAVVLNSLGLARAGIGRDAPDPSGGFIERDAAGEPTGLLLEAGGWLRERVGPRRGEADQAAGIALLNETLLRYGVTAAQDAGADNGLARWRTFAELKRSGQLKPRITMLAGATRLAEFSEAGLRFGDGEGGLRLGHAKIMLTLSSGKLAPGYQELADLIAEAHRRGFLVAIHAVEREAVVAAALALREARESGARLFAPDRIEHCAECPPDVLELVKVSGALVATQPGFIHWQGEVYRREVAPELAPWLCPAGALARAGVPLAFGSDTPVIDPNPWAGIQAAVTGCAGDGRPLAGGGAAQRVGFLEALRAYTDGGGPQRGTITPGQPADLVLWDAHPTGVEPERLKDIRAALTIVGGVIVWKDLAFFPQLN